VETENKSEYQAATQESVWAAFRETDKQIKEQSAAFDRVLEKSREEWDRKMAESCAEREKSQADYEKRMKKFEETMGSWSNNHGSFAEEYFFNSFENGRQIFFGEEFDEIEKSAKGFKKGFKDEYDILLINGKSVGIIEVKFKAHQNDIPKVLGKAKTFRENFPYYANHQVYLGLATLVFYPELEQECINQGIAVVKQVGDTVVINDKHLKIF
jgi:uncharacterized protein YdcH (DUF465 family)